jgi:hypothetical protein
VADFPWSVQAAPDALLLEQVIASHRQRVPATGMLQFYCGSRDQYPVESAYRFSGIGLAGPPVVSRRLPQPRGVVATWANRGPRRHSPSLRRLLLLKCRPIPRYAPIPRKTMPFPSSRLSFEVPRQVAEYRRCPAFDLLAKTVLLHSSGCPT